MPVKPSPVPAPEDATSYAELLPIETYRIGKLTYVAGLLWEPLTTAHGYMKSVRAYGAQHGLDTAIVNKASTAMQAGYGVSAKGAVPNAASLAAVVASLLGDDFIGVFELDSETYALVAVMEGAVVPGADRIGDDETIRDEFTAISERYEGGGRPFARTLAPEGFFDDGINAEPVDLLRLLKPKAVKRSHRLIRIGKGAKGATAGGGHGLKIVIVLLLAIGAAGGWYYWKTVQDEKAAQALAEQQRMAAAHAEAARKQAAAAVKVPPKPWVDQPPVSAFVSHCSTQLGKLPLAAAGWELEGATCRAEGLRATYTRTGTATVAQVEAALMASLGVKPNIRSSGDEAGIVVGFEPPAAGDESLIAASDARTSVVSHFQALAVPVALTREPDPPAPDDGQPPPPPPPWVIYTVAVPATSVTALETAHHPSLLLSNLDVPGLRLETISVKRSPDAPFLMWSAMGRLYVDR